MFIDRWDADIAVGSSEWAEAYLLEPTSRKSVYGMAFHVSTIDMEMRISNSGSSWVVDLAEISSDFKLTAYDIGGGGPPFDGGGTTSPSVIIPRWIYEIAPNRFAIEYPEPESVANFFKVEFKATNGNRTVYRGFTTRNNR